LEEHRALGKQWQTWLKGKIMALEKTVTTPHGFDAVDAYHRVESVQVNKDKMTFQVRSYKDNSGFPHFDNLALECIYSIAGENPIKQAYAHLKTLPEFAGATDC
jgi:hypothetical protein